MSEDLIKAYDEYITLLDEELKEIIPLAYNHGWRSSRYEKGEEARKKIELLKKELKTPEAIK